MTKGDWVGSAELEDFSAEDSGEGNLVNFVCCKGRKAESSGRKRRRRSRWSNHMRSVKSKFLVKVGFSQNSGKKEIDLCYFELMVRDLVYINKHTICEI